MTHILTVGLIGDTNTGKTTLSEYLSNLAIDFDSYDPTFGTNLSIIRLNNNTLHIRLLDISGSKNHTHLIFLYGPVCNVLVFTYSLSDPSSLDYIKTLYNDHKDTVAFKNKKYFVLATKSDIKSTSLLEDGHDFAYSINASFIEISTKNNYNIPHFLFLLQQHAPQTPTTPPNTPPAPKKKCNIF